MSLPEFENPPIVETVIGVQFEPIEGFTAAHAGLFWGQFLRENWNSATEAPMLPTATTQYGALHFTQPSLQLVKTMHNRVQITNVKNDRMIQIQNSRLILNWRKTDEPYARFPNLLSEFNLHLSAFNEFLRGRGLSEVKPNAWELTYVNHIDRGDLWSTVSDWGNIFPGLLNPWPNDRATSIESYSSQWIVAFPANLGRLQVVLQHIRKGDDVGSEAVDLRLIATGVVNAQSGLQTGLHLGRTSIVEHFTSMTSKAAHDHWQRVK